MLKFPTLDTLLIHSTILMSFTTNTMKNIYWLGTFMIDFTLSPIVKILQGNPIFLFIFGAFHPITGTWMSFVMYLLVYSSLDIDFILLLLGFFLVSFLRLENLYFHFWILLLNCFQLKHLNFAGYLFLKCKGYTKECYKFYYFSPSPFHQSNLQIMFSFLE